MKSNGSDETGGSAGSGDRYDRTQSHDIFAISPLDGRYKDRLKGLEKYFSEGALIRYRIGVEAQWLIYLHEVLPDLKPLPPKILDYLQGAGFDHNSGEPHALESADLEQVKAIESKTNHDVKAVEYYLRGKLGALGASPQILAMIHFACTSEDINNLAYGLMLKNYRDKRLVPLYDQLLQVLSSLVSRYKGHAILARTHGQTASPTTMGKELAVFAHRLSRQRNRLVLQPIEGKINGAVGNYNAHVAAYPDVSWPKIAKIFLVDYLGLFQNPLTTQIENHDSLIETLEILHHINAILIGLCRDLWSYTSIGYFKQKTSPDEVGSSTMPHKVNPIDFENAEGNLGIAMGLIRHFNEKLPISRWQRDLTDSTVMRSIGVIMGHTELAWKSLQKGLQKIDLDPQRTALDLDQSWEVLAEPLQTVLRRFGVVDAYERLKQATRGLGLTRQGYLDLVASSHEIPEEFRSRLMKLEPYQYTGLAERLAEDYVSRGTP